MINMWDERYAGNDYLFGTEPNAFFVSQQHLLLPGLSCLAVADGEGRNGVWLAQQGLNVLSVEGSAVALEKAHKLAGRRGVEISFEQADLEHWNWGENRFDVVAAIFIQFAGPALRAQMFGNIRRCLKPGGLLLLQGYTPRQLQFRTGGPPVAENMYSEALLRESFADMEWLHFAEHDSVIREGTGHHGVSALIELAARKRIA